MFGPTPLTAADLASHQAAAIDRFCNGAAFSIMRQESGILPMGIMAPFASPGPDYFRAGLMSSAARPSTGYAFQRIQRWAEASVASIERGGPLLAHRLDPAVRRAMDRLFLRVVRAHPERAPELFVRLFSLADPSRIIRFLSDQGTFADCAAVVSALPTWLFLRELLDGSSSIGVARHAA